jgi:hypothetical protein
MYRLNLGGGAVAFEVEGEADRVGSLDPDELAKLGWPAEMVENYRHYRQRSLHRALPVRSSVVAAEDSSTPDRNE